MPSATMPPIVGTVAISLRFRPHWETTTITVIDWFKIVIFEIENKLINERQ